MTTNKTSIAKLLKAAAILLTAGRKDEVLKKYPALEKQIKYFIEQDPSGNQKYLEWSCMILDSGQALEREISDVVKLFDKYAVNLPKKDINKYSVKEFTGLRDKLFALDEKRTKTKEKYQMPADCKSEVIYDSDNFLVRHILNKAASVHFGKGTQWCITMESKTFYEDYDSNNVVFFFIFDKKIALENNGIDVEDPAFNQCYKLAVSVQRDADNFSISTEYWDAANDQLDSISEQLGSENAAIEAKIDQVAANAPKSMLAKLASGEATEEEIKNVYELYKNKPKKEKNVVFELIAKNTTSPDMLYDLWNSYGGNYSLSVRDLLPILLDNEYCSESFLREIDAVLSSRGDRNNSGPLFLQILKHPKCPQELFKDVAHYGSNAQEAATKNPNCPFDILVDIARQNIAEAEAEEIGSIAHMPLIQRVYKNPKCPKDIFDYVKLREEDLTRRRSRN